MANNWLVGFLLVSLLAIALFYDVATRRIPNWLVLAGLIVGVACSLAYAGSASGIGNSLLGALTGLVIMLPLYFLHAMGAGDAKLMAAVGAFLGPTQVAGAALLTFVAGGILSLVVAFWSGSLLRVLGNLRLMGFVLASSRASGFKLSDIQTTGRLPYAIAIAIGTGLQLWLAARGGWFFV